MLGKIILLVILAAGISLAVPSTRAKVMEAAAPVMNRFKAKLVPTRLDTMADQLAVRVNRGEGFPSSWESWLNRDFTGAPEDPWGNLYYLQTGRRGFTVGSAGPDGVQGNEDDIKVTRNLGDR
ncbi:MAG TPA: type II secretion system protein GspG [Longimicrobiales bacterium]|nr:type II secretion system protein GspG [Longimicrobiales bacterium]